MEKNEYELARSVLELAYRIVANRNSHICELGITTEQSDSLHFFSENNKSAIKDLQKFLCVKHQNTQGIVQRMIDKNLLVSSVSENDSRYQLLSLT